VSAEFVSLADVLRGPAPPPAPATAVAASEEPATARAEVPPASGVAADELDAALRDARLFRARLADAFDEAAARLLRELAADVLARELRLAPCDVAHVVRRIAACAPAVRVRVAPGDAAGISGIDVVADADLCAGDAIVELAGGALDARLGVRLAAVIEAFG
jgi:hypothetical protein